MLPGQKFTPEEAIRLVMRRKWLVLVPFAIGLAAAPAIARYVPELFRSETLIMVVPQRVPDSYVKPTVTATIEDRLPSISEQILSRSRLERIIADFELYPRERARGIMEDVVERMRRDITVKLVNKESFRVSYVNREPKTAQRVTERLASLYIEENLRDRENQAQSTSQFLETELEDAKRRLQEQERKLEEYRRQHAGQLPSQVQSNLQSVQSAQLQLQALNESMNRARERRLLVERQLADAQVVPTPAVQPGAAGDQDPMDATPPTAARQLELVEERLKIHRQRYTDDHPDVRNLERIKRELEGRVAEEAKGPAAQRVASPVELARQKRVRDLQAELDVIDHNLTSTQAEATRLRTVIGDFQARLETLPKRESELVELTRDYATLEAAYRSLLVKREDSKLAANLERRQIGEQFRVLDPASMPEKPYNQLQRLGLTGGGALGGLALGLGVVLLLAYRDSTFRHEDDAVRLLNLPVLALVPLLPTRAEVLTRRRKSLLADAAGTGVLLGCAAVLILWRLLP
jgi:polysaccharide chain length determinant protein (PEP-CTERM system associated)